jgi:hypothetical protein
MSVDDTERIRFGARLRHAPKAEEVVDTLITPPGELVQGDALRDPQRGVR